MLSEVQGDGSGLVLKVSPSASFVESPGRWMVIVGSSQQPWCTFAGFPVSWAWWGVSQLKPSSPPLRKFRVGEKTSFILMLKTIENGEIIRAAFRSALTFPKLHPSQALPAKTLALA